MIRFESVSCRNFFSVGNIPITIQLDKSPTTLITGSNGSGKSSCILDSVYFALFGKPFRSVNIPQVINSISGGDCVVELKFSTGGKKYLVRRGLKPKIFEIYENDKLVDQDAAARDYQKHLENTILGGVNETVFKQIVVIGSADYRPFMQLPAAARREVIEELLDIKIFSHMMDIVKQKLVLIKESLKDYDYKIELAKEKLDLQLENRKKVREQNKNKKETLLEAIKKEDEEIEKIQTHIQDLLKSKEDLVKQCERISEFENKSTESKNSIIKLNSNIESLEKTLKFFSINDVCPTCQQGIPHTHKESIVNTTKQSKQNFLDFVSEEKQKLDKISKILDIMQKVQLKVNNIDKAIYKHQMEISSRQKYIKNVKKEIEDIQINLPVEDSTKELEKIFLDLKEQRISVIEEREYYEAISGLLKDGGIKTRIIRQYIPLMNKIINEYLIRFGLPIEFTLDEQFNEVIKSRYRDAFKYNSFSEGEKQRIDLSLLLAWRYIAKSKNTTNTNLLILDETFDSSLDTAATEELLNVLLSQDKGTNIFIISHKNDLSDKLRSQIIFEKHNNYTRIAKEVEDV